MNQLVKLVMALALVAFLATTALSAEGGNPRKGKALFKKTCKECHSKGAAAGEVTPLTKTMEQWDRFFEKKQHNPEGLKGPAATGPTLPPLTPHVSWQGRCLFPGRRVS